MMDSEWNRDVLLFATTWPKAWPTRRARLAPLAELITRGDDTGGFMGAVRGGGATYSSVKRPIAAALCKSRHQIKSLTL